MSYGSSLQYENTLNQDDFKTYLREETTSLTSVLRTILTIGGAAAMFIPGIGVAAELALSLGVGAGMQFLDYAQGTMTIKNTLLNFGVPLLASGFAGFQNIKALSKLKYQTKILERASEERLAVGVLNAIPEEEIAKSLANRKLIESLENISAFEAANYGIKGVVRSSAKGQSPAMKKLIKDLSKINNDIFQEAVVSLESIKREKVNRLALEKVGLDTSEINEIMNKVRGLSPIEQNSAILSELRNLPVLTTHRTLLREVIQNIEMSALSLNEAYQYPIALSFQRNVSAYESVENINAAATASKNSRLSGWAQLRENWKTAFSRKSNLTPAQRLSRAFGTKTYNDLVVQPTQAALDANDSGRILGETLYRWGKKKVDKWFSSAERIIMKADKIEDAFTAAGGIVLSSGWILGYRIIKETPIQTLIQISFKPEETNSKLPVAIWATPLQIQRFAIDPGNYYIEKWAMSRGGKKLELSSLISFSWMSKNPGKSSRAAAQFLGFLPIDALRNIWSQVSNVVENVYSMKQGTWWKGEYNKRTNKYENTYGDRFAKAATRTLVNRPIRLATRGIMGGAIGKMLGSARMGRYIGKELQRIGSQVMAPIVHNLMWISTHAKENAARDPYRKRKWNSGITTTKLINAGLTSVKSHMIRKVRGARPNAVFLHTFSGQRKMKQVFRAPNTFTPGRKFKGGRFYKKGRYI